MTSSHIVARLRAILFLLKSANRRPSLKVITEELEKLLEDVKEYPSRYEPLRFALSALLHSVKRGESGNYYVTDAQMFIWAIEELAKITNPLLTDEKST